MPDRILEYVCIQKCMLQMTIVVPGTYLPAIWCCSEIRKLSPIIKNINR